MDTGSEIHGLGKAVDPVQQLGLTKERDRAGGTGRAGCSKAGKRLANFFIARLLDPYGDNS
jgi:hypothetical protein